MTTCSLRNTVLLSLAAAMLHGCSSQGRLVVKSASKNEVRIWVRKSPAEKPRELGKVTAGSEGEYTLKTDEFGSGAVLWFQQGADPIQIVPLKAEKMTGSGCGGKNTTSVEIDDRGMAHL